MQRVFTQTRTALILLILTLPFSTTLSFAVQTPPLNTLSPTTIPSKTVLFSSSSSSSSSSSTSHYLGHNDPTHIPSVLQNITSLREQDTLAAQTQIPAATLRNQIKLTHSTLGPPLNLLDHIKSSHPVMSLAGEFKRASPSKGVISAARGPEGAAAQALKYFKAGASVISTLTEATHFQGCLEDLTAVRTATQAYATANNLQRPAILRKDFITSRYQILEAAAAGADTLLLIVAVTPSDVLQDLIEYSRSLGMEPLVEVHDEKEVPVAIAAGALVIGVNNRNLHNFKMSLTTTPVTANLLTEAGVNFTPGDPAATHVLCSLSGMSCSDDVAMFRDAGVSLCLIGESLMRAVDPEAAIKALGLDPDAVTGDDSSMGGAYTDSLKITKVCGITNPADALVACRAGANLIGVIFAKGSKREVTREQAREVCEAVWGFGERDGPELVSSSSKPYGVKAREFGRRSSKPRVVGVFQNEDSATINSIVKECGLDLVQLHGDEGFEFCSSIDVPCIRVVDIADDDSRDASVIGGEIVDRITNECACVLLDTSVKGQGGGAGTVFNWDVAKHVQGCGFPVMVAGGLTADNVADVVTAVGCFGVDVSSGVEASYGVKDSDKVTKFVTGAVAAGERVRDGI